MRLTSFTDYGLRMMMRMASAPGTAFSTAEIAEEFGLSRHHLAKIMQRLSRGGLIETRRGGGGGAVLAKSPGEITIGAIVRLLEEGQALVAQAADPPEGLLTVEAHGLEGVGAREATQRRDAQSAPVEQTSPGAQPRQSPPQSMALSLPLSSSS